MAAVCPADPNEKNVSIENLADFPIYVRVGVNQLKSVEFRGAHGGHVKNEDEQTKERTYEVGVGVEGAGNVTVKHGRKDGERHLREKSQNSAVWSKKEWGTFIEAGFRCLAEKSKPVKFGGLKGQMVFITLYWYETDGDDEKQKEKKETNAVRMYCDDFNTWATKFEFNGVSLEEIDLVPPVIEEETEPEEVDEMPRSHYTYSLKGMDGKYLCIDGGWVYQNGTRWRDCRWRCCEVFEDDRKRWFLKGANVNNYCGHWLSYKKATQWVEVLGKCSQRARCTLYPTDKAMHFKIKISWHKEQQGWLNSDANRSVVLVKDESDAEIYHFEERPE